MISVLHSVVSKKNSFIHIYYCIDLKLVNGHPYVRDIHLILESQFICICINFFLIHSITCN